MVDDFQYAKLLERVALLERQVEFLLVQARVPYVDRPAQIAYPDVAELKRKGNLIEAIKLYRSYTDTSLQAAKEYVENMVV
jgi:ribosomal protein L7/L12